MVGPDVRKLLRAPVGRGLESRRDRALVRASDLHRHEWKEQHKTGAGITMADYCRAFLTSAQDSSGALAVPKCLIYNPEEPGPDGFEIRLRMVKRQICMQKQGVF
jgi:hypothetical protein